MKSAFYKDVLRAVTHSLGRFLAIAGIVALGAGFYAGLRMTAPDMMLSADEFYDGTALMDVRVVSTLGLTDDDLAALRQVDGVEAVMGAYETDVMVSLHGERYAVRVHSLYGAARTSDTSDGVNALSDDADYLNRPLLVEGAWPEREGECVMSADVVMAEPLTIGDVVVVTEGAGDVDATLVTRTYTVVGLVSSSYYATSSGMGSTTLGSGSIQQFMYVPEQTFAADIPYSEAFLTVRGAADKLASSEAYDELVDAAKAAIEDIAPVRERARASSLKADAQAELDDARAEYDQQCLDVQTQLTSAHAQLDEAAATLATSEQELSRGQEEYDAGVAALAQQKEAAEAQFQTAEQQLAAAQTALAAKKTQLDEAAVSIEEARGQLAALEAQRDALVALADQREQAGDAQGAAEARTQAAALDEQLTAGRAQLVLSEVAYDEGGAAYAAGIAEIDRQRGALEQARTEAAAQMQVAERQLAQAAAQLASGRAQLAYGRADYETGTAAYDEARAQADEQLASAASQLEDAQRAIDELEAPTWYVMDRTQNYGVTSFKADADRVDSIASVFPFIFFLVAALVALTTMTRMVEEERALIGTYKALGYTRRRIASKYLIYAACASGVGSIVGIAVLSQVLPAVIQKAYAIIYFVPQGPLPIEWSLAAVAAGMGVGTTLVATWAAAYATLRERPALLMLPRAPKAGKRILLERVRPVWRRLSFSWKVTFRNLFRYKKRFVMTMVGIAGCTALLLTGLGLSDAINDIIDKQFGQIMRYNTTIVTDEDAGESAQTELDAVLSEDVWVSASTHVMHRNVVATSTDGADMRVQVMVPQEPERFGDFFTLRTRVGQQPLELGEEGVVLAEKMASRMGVSVGDEVVLREQDAMGNATGEPRTLVVTGVMENYLYNYAFIGSVAYEKAWGEEPVYGSVLAQTTTDANERAAFGEVVQNLDAVRTLTYNDETIETYESMLSSVNLIVVVLVVAAAALAFIVLYNLTNINITERVREIATLKVLGFTPREVDAYIYRETLLLSVVGCAVGLVLGVFMESFVVATAEVDQVMFGREIHAASFVLAFVLTMLFTVLVMLAMRHKLARVNMVESLKSNE